MKKVIEKLLQTLGIEYKTITKSSSGFTSNVYFIDDKYVIKLSDSNNLKLQKEILVYKNLNVNYIPKLITCGEMDGVLFLIIEKLEGDSLFHVWHTLDENNRVKVLEKISQILNDIHLRPFEFLPESEKKLDWLNFVKSQFDIAISILKSYNIDVTWLDLEVYRKLDKYFDKNHISLIYNDLHFDNFIFNGNELWLIDFDRVMSGSLDYELLILSLMTDSPTKFANELDEPNVKKNDYLNIDSVMKKYCPNMYNYNYIRQRVEIYKFIYRTLQGGEYNNRDAIIQAVNLFKEKFQAED